MIPRYAIDQIRAAFPPTARPGHAGRSNVIRLPLGPKPAHIEDQDSPNLNANAHEGMPSGFEALSGGRQNQMLATMLELPAIKAMADASRPDWLRVLFAVAHAELLGATDARALALAWSKLSPRFKDEADFDRDWRSFDPARPRGITIATLIAMARDSGFDIAAWLHDPPPNDTTGAASPGYTQVGQPPAWSIVTAIMDAASAGPMLNQLLGFARKFGGGPSYFLRQVDGTVSPIGREGLSAILAPYRVRVGTRKDARLTPAATWWTTWHGRYAVDTVAYDPEDTREQSGETIENTWRGFAIQPSKGSWKLISWHLLNIICDGNKTYFEYLVRWLAHAVQRPGTAPEVMVVLRSTAEGVGKSTVGHLMLRMFGIHGHVANGINEIFGDFNEVIVGKSFILLEENAFPGDHKLAAAMKGIVTANAISINPKGRPRYSIPNMLHMLLTTNEEWAIPAGADARRFFVLEVTRKEDHSYFDSLRAEMNSGGVEAMLHDLLQIDLVSFNPRAVPVTAALVRQQRLSADDITGWIMDALVNGALTTSALVKNGGFGQAVPGTVLYAEYCSWTRTRGHRPKSSIDFGRALKKLGMVRSKSNNPATWTVPDWHTLLKAAEARARIRKVTS